MHSAIMPFTALGQNHPAITNTTYLPTHPPTKDTSDLSHTYKHAWPVTQTYTNDTTVHSHCRTNSSLNQYSGSPWESNIGHTEWRDPPPRTRHGNRSHPPVLVTVTSLGSVSEIIFRLEMSFRSLIALMIIVFHLHKMGFGLQIFPEAGPRQFSYTR